MVRPTSIELKIDAKDAAQILEALHLRMSVLPVRIDGRRVRMSSGVGSILAAALGCLIT